MTEKTENVICPHCRSTVKKIKFCTECGFKLENAMPADMTFNQSIENVDDALCLQKSNGCVADTGSYKTLSDEGLTMLVNICKKTIATVGGDGYSEIVLYVDEKTQKYWLHTYSKYVFMHEEAHESYETTPEFADKIFNYIEEHQLVLWKNYRGFALCGGDYVINFKHGDEWIHLGSANMPDSMKAYFELSSMLYGEATEENRRCNPGNS